MLKIVDVHLSTQARGEYIVLRNEGVQTVQLRGWALCDDSYLSGDPYAAAPGMFIFTEETSVKPYGRVVLFTGHGHNGWQPTIDGKQAYVAYWRKSERVWQWADRVVLLQPAEMRRIARPTDAPVSVEG